MRPIPLAIALLVLSAFPTGGCRQSEGAGARDEPVAAGDAAPAIAPPTSPSGALPCEPASFASELALPEASGATWLEVDGAPAVLVVGDSGTRGAYALIDPATGAIRERGALPLGTGASDDLEGVTAMDGRVWGLTSAGWMRVWTRSKGGFALLDGPYPIAPVDASLPARSTHGTDTRSLACVGRGVNCGKNYEGVCLRPRGGDDDACAGFAASRVDGRLWCLVRQGARVVADPARSIAAARPLSLTGCDFSPDGEALWAGTNLLDAARVYRIRDWRTPATARAEPVAILGAGFPEALAIGPDGAVFRFSDTSAATSLQAKFRCR